MAKINIKYTVPTPEETIDLCDYGHEEETQWSDLSEDERNEILDPLRESQILNVEVTIEPE